MTLKTRLRLTIAIPLLAIALGYSALSLFTTAGVLFAEAARGASLLASHTQTLLLQRIDDYRAIEPSSSPPPARESLWASTLARDEALARMLEQTMASSRTVVEIAICGATGLVLSSSNPSSIGKSAPPAASLEQWARRGRLSQIWRVFTTREEYQTTIPLGFAGRGKPVFEIRVLLSSVLLRNALEPEVRNLLYALALSLLAALFIAALTANLAFLPLRKLSEAIDRVSRGEPLSSAPLRESREFQAVESKLSLLGAQVRGAREDLKQMRVNVQQLLERMQDAVLLFDEQERLVNAGRALEKFLGQGRWQLNGAHVSELFPPGSPAGDLITGAMALRQNLDGASSTLGPHSVALDLEVLEARGFLLTIRDVEAKLSLSHQLDLSQRLSAINSLTSGVAHEIKNPLNSIGLHLEILNATIGQSHPTAAEEIRILREETLRLDRVVKTFLNFTKPVELKLAPLDLVSLLNGLLQFLGPEATRHRVHLLLDVGVNQAPLQGDADLLKQAFLNLFRNGIEAMPDGGPLHVGITPDGPHWLVTITDRGIGIPTESRPRIFQLYFSTKSNGTGIGLAVTYRVVQLHNGSIDFVSANPAGTSFLVRLPRIEEN
ncbi:MAG: sensor histidine kinase [Acidobacteriota bacterium]